MSETICGIPYEDHGEYAEIWREKRVRTRKPHHCCECYIMIPVGEEVGRATGLFDGRWYTDYRCASCLILAEMAATVVGACALWGGLGEQLSGMSDPLPSPREHRKLWEAAGDDHE